MKPFFIRSSWAALPFSWAQWTWTRGGRGSPFTASTTRPSRSLLLSSLSTSSKWSLSMTSRTLFKSPVVYTQAVSLSTRQFQQQLLLQITTYFNRKIFLCWPENKNNSILEKFQPKFEIIKLRDFITNWKTQSST